MTDKDEFSAENLSPDELRLLGAHICRRRVKLGLTQRDLVNETFYERQLNEVESGRVAPSNDFLAYLAGCLGITPQELLEPAPVAIEAEKTSQEDAKTAAQELALMNAHFNIEINQPETALGFLVSYEDNPDELGAELKPVFFRLRGNARFLMQRYREAEPDLAEALNLFESCHPHNIFQTEVVRNLLGLNFYREGRIKEALKQHQRCLEAVTRGDITNPHFRLMLFSNLANDHYMMGRSDLALKIFENDALPLAEYGEDDLLVAGIYWGAGLAYQARNDLKQAVKYLSLSVQLYQKIGAWKMAVQAQDQLGLLYIRGKDFEQAEKTMFSALRQVERMNDLRTKAYVILNIAFLYQESGKLDLAAGYAKTGVEISRGLEDKILHGQGLVTLARIKFDQGQAEIAFEIYDEAIRILEQTNQVQILENSLEDYADALKKAGNIEKALEIRMKMGHLV